MTTIYYLQMQSASELKPKPPVEGFEIHEAKIKQYQLNRYLYCLVGEAWQWFDKADWSSQQWRDYVEQNDIRTWVAYIDGTPAGYFELKRQQDTVDIAYFGLAESFLGKGYGGYFLSYAISQAWSWGGTQRVTVNTCDLDHPSALKNYLSRGFSLIEQT